MAKRHIRRCTPGFSFASNIQPIRSRHSPVPEAGVFYRAFLVPEVHIGKAVALTVAIGPLEVVKGTPRVGRTSQKWRKGEERFFCVGPTAYNAVG